MKSVQQRPADTDRVRLYERIAAQIERLIEYGAFRPGERIPSVRELSQQWNDLA